MKLCAKRNLHLAQACCVWDMEKSLKSGGTGFDNPRPGERHYPNNSSGNRTELYHGKQNTLDSDEAELIVKQSPKSPDHANVSANIEEANGH